MDELYAQYERELVAMRLLCREYAERYPKAAAQLQLGGDTCDDPHVERLIQSVALLCARVSKRMDDSYPQFTEALLNLLLPHYLRPFPSCAIVQFAPAASDHTASTVIARGTALASKLVDGVSCTFRTVYDVAPGQASITAVRFDAIIQAPQTVKLAPNITSSISIDFAIDRAEAPLTTAPLRLYLNGDPSFCAALRDALFMHASRGFLQAQGSSSWLGMPTLPIAAVGFDADQALLPPDARSHPAYRTLAEYFAFPEKFNFVDIDLAALMARLPEQCSRFTLHLALENLAADSRPARMLGSLSAHHLVAGCTPVVNLFQQRGKPLQYKQLTADYPVLADAAHPAAYAVYSIDRVYLLNKDAHTISGAEYQPFYALRHGQRENESGRYWLMRHDDTLATTSPGHEKSISLVDAIGTSLSIETTTLAIELTCTNRDAPCLLKCGAPEGDLVIPGTAKGRIIRFLRRPTRPHQPPSSHSAPWRLISHLALNLQTLGREGVDGLRELLTLYDVTRSTVSRHQIAGITQLELSNTTAWLKHKRGASLAPGTELRLTLDQQAFAGTSLHLFVQAIEQFFALYVQMNSFVELVILSHPSGEELVRCKPRSGNMPLC